MGHDFQGLGMYGRAGCYGLGGADLWLACQDTVLTWFQLQG